MFNPDIPISQSSEDLLNRKGFAENIAKAMLSHNAEGAFSIGLYGEWGSGKSSVLNMIIEHIKTDENVLIMHFNPWLCAEPKQLISQFFKQLATTMKIKSSKLEKLGTLIENYGGVFELTGAIPVVGSFLVPFFTSITNKVSSYNQIKRNDLQYLKNQITEVLAREKIKIIVTIDDIDRLSEQEIISVFQLVKSLADFPHMVYLLVFDYNVVIEALSKVQNGDGTEYLEKIIQVPFQLPAAQLEDIHHILFEKLNVILAQDLNDNWDSSSWGQLFHLGLKNYITSIRDVIRFTNVLSLKYAMLKGETNPQDLLGITCLQVFEPMLYAKISLYKEQLCGAKSTGYQQLEKEEQKLTIVMEDILSKRNTNNHDAAHNILEFLFPKIITNRNSWVNSSRQYINQNFLLSGNIAHPYCFQRYFALTLEKEAISTVLINNLVWSAANDEVIDNIEKFNKDGKIARFLEYVESSILSAGDHLSKSNRMALLLECISILWDGLDDPDEEDTFFSLSLSWRLSLFLDILLQNIDITQRYELMLSLYQNDKVSISALSYMLHCCQRQHNRFTTEDYHDSNQLITLEELYNLESLYIERFSTEWKNRSILKHNDLIQLIDLAEKIEPKITCWEKSELITDDISLIRLILNCTSHGRVAGGAIHKTWHVDLGIIGVYIDLSKAICDISAFVKTDRFKELSVKDQEDIVAFLIKIENPETSTFDHHGISDKAINTKLQVLLKHFD